MMDEKIATSTFNKVVIFLLHAMLLGCDIDASVFSDSAPQFALVSTNMKLRSSPDTLSSTKVYHIINSGEIVEYMSEKSKDRLSLIWSDGEHNDFWYKVKVDREKDNIGWIYGGGLKFHLDSLKEAKLLELEVAFGTFFQDLKFIDACEFRSTFSINKKHLNTMNGWKELGLQKPKNISIFTDNLSIDNEPIWYIRSINYSYPFIFGIIVYVDEYMGGFRLINYDLNGNIIKMIPIAYCDGDAFEYWQADLEIINEDEFKFYYNDSGDELEDGSYMNVEGVSYMKMNSKGKLERKILQRKESKRSMN